MPKPRRVEVGHWIRKKRGTWIIAVPPEIRRLLGVTHRMLLYWHHARTGEAVLAPLPERIQGRTTPRRLARELMEARGEIEAIRHRDELRDRSMYAEGFAHGYLQARARLDMPGGPSAERGHRRSMWSWAFPEAASVEDPKQLAPRPAPARPRMNARTRRAKRDERLARRAVETYQLPSPGETSPEPAPTRTGADAATAEAAPQALPVEK